MGTLRALQWASISRLLVLSLCLLCDWRLADHIPQGIVQHFDTEKVFLLKTFTRWDAAHYLSIASGGYSYEQALAFFPAYPFFLRILTDVFPTEMSIQKDTILILTGLVVSNFLFVGSTVVFSYLCTDFGLSSRQSILALLLFCFNPASVFFSTVYSESMYCFSAMLALALYNRSQYAFCALFYFLASATRSTGVLNAIPILLDLLRLGSKSDCTWQLSLLFIISIPPLVWNSYLRYRLFSDSEECPWNVYSHLQAKHWNVGFLRQYQLRQLPNFALALPVFCFSIHAIYKCFEMKVSMTVQMKGLYLRHCVHLLSLLLLGGCVAHIQVTTRLVFSSAPIVYILFARYFTTASILWKKMLIVYFSVYFVCGIALHANFYPWT
jgi:GPI mannosyltransferase 2